MTEREPTPSKEAIALLPVFDRLGLEQITLVATAAQASQALHDLQNPQVLGFDTESKPTFVRHEISDGPHIVQLATHDHAWIFQLQDSGCRQAVGHLLAHPHLVKAGFGLGDDVKRIKHKLGIEPEGMIDLNRVFQQRGYRKDIGVRGAVAVMFSQRFIKSKQAATSNWAKPALSTAQLIYAANDAYAALRVWLALEKQYLA